MTVSGSGQNGDRQQQVMSGVQKTENGGFSFLSTGVEVVVNLSRSFRFSSDGQTPASPPTCTDRPIRMYGHGTEPLVESSDGHGDQWASRSCRLLCLVLLPLLSPFFSRNLRSCLRADLKVYFCFFLSACFSPGLHDQRLVHPSPRSLYFLFFLTKEKLHSFFVWLWGSCYVVESLSNVLMVALVATTIDPVFSVPPVFRSLILVRAFYVMIWLRLLLVMWSFVSRFCLCLTMMTRIVWFFVFVVFARSHSVFYFCYIQ